MEGMRKAKKERRPGLVPGTVSEAGEARRQMSAEEGLPAGQGWQARLVYLVLFCCVTNKHTRRATGTRLLAGRVAGTPGARLWRHARGRSGELVVGSSNTRKGLFAGFVYCII